jgi:hypothetical protein
MGVMATMKILRSSLFAFVFLNLFLPLRASGQISSGQNPPGIEWKAIETSHFEIVFPEEIKNDAQRLANTLEHIFHHNCKTLETEPGKLSVLMDTHLSESNGYATLMPRHTEFFNTPPQESFAGPMDWYNTLALHEFRHIIQLDRGNHGFTRLMYYLFGALGQTVSFNLSTPTWLMEGDAVCTETALSSCGRGRQPSFDVELRALLLSKDRPSYYKAMFGSYKDWYPLDSDYLMGYYMVTHARRNHGANVWSSVLSLNSIFPFVPQMFSFAVNSATDGGAPRNYMETMDEMEGLWRKQIEGLRITSANLLHEPNNDAWTYNNAPQYTSDGDIVVLRYGLEDVPHLVKINPSTKQEEDLLMLGKISYFVPSVSGQKIVWAEHRFDPRWGKCNYSVIKTYDMKTNREETLTRQSRFFAPSLSPDLKRIATIEFNTKNESSIVILDAETGKIINRLQNPWSEFLQTPRWSPDGNSIVFCKIDKAKGNSICLTDLETHAVQEIVPFTFETLSSPVTDGEYIYFASSHSGIDNIYAADVRTKKVSQVTSRKFGAYNPSLSPDRKRMAFNDVTGDGYMAVEMPLKPEEWTPIDRVENRSIRYYEPLISQEAGGNILKDIPNRQYAVKDYSSLGNLINIYTWSIFADPWAKDASVSLGSLNLLNTLGTSLGYRYNWNEQTHAVSLGLSYAGLYPILDLGANYGGRASQYSDSTGTRSSYSWRETSVSGGFRLPLNLTSSRYTTSLSFGATASYSKISDLTHTWDLDRTNGVFFPVSYWLSFFRGYSWLKDIYPVWGQSVDISYTHTPFEGDYKGSLFSALGTFYFPGVFKHHSLITQLGYEHQEPADYIFGSRFRFSRGYEHLFHTDFFKGGINYTFPLLYPDLNILHILHIKRFSSNLFYDYLEGRDGGKKFLYRSAGAELATEIRLFAIDVLPLQIGIRYSYLLDEKKRDVSAFFSL